MALSLCALALPAARSDERELDPSAPSPLSIQGDRFEALGEVHQITLSCLADTYVANDQPTTNYGAAPEMHVGYRAEDGPSGAARALMRFDMAPLRDVSPTIHMATLNVCLVSSWDVPEATRTYTAHRLQGAWSEMGVTWETAPLPAEAYGSARILHADWGWFSLDVTRLVRVWLQEGMANDGLALLGPPTVPNRRGFGTSEGPYAPYLVVAYEGEPPLATATATHSPTCTRTPTATPTASLTPSPSHTPSPPRTIFLPLVMRAPGPRAAEGR